MIEEYLPVAEDVNLEDRIAELEATIARLRDALEDIAWSCQKDGSDFIANKARQALNPNPDVEITRKELAIAKPGTFEWALIQMKAGKKVRRKAWCKRQWLAILYCGERMMYCQTNVLLDDFNETLADDWEVKE